MIINIQALLKELVSYTRIKTSNISGEAKSLLSDMRKEFEILEASSYSYKQTHMIKLFIGGTILALKRDDWKYKYPSFKLYPQALTEKVLKNVQGKISDLNTMYTVGEQALLHIPKTFNGNIFNRKGLLINTDEPISFFPELNENADKINLLVKFCMKYKDNLETAEVEADDLNSIDLNLPDEIENTVIPTPEVHQSPTPTASTPFSNVSMQVLGGFMTIVGSAAIALAFVALNAATFGVAGLVVASLGVAAALGGFGLFVTGTYRKYQSASDIAIDNSLQADNSLGGDSGILALD